MFETKPPLLFCEILYRYVAGQYAYSLQCMYMLSRGQRDLQLRNCLLASAELCMCCSSCEQQICLRTVKIELDRIICSLCLEMLI